MIVARYIISLKLAFGGPMLLVLTLPITTQELAAYFWDRHKSRNASVITKLIQVSLLTAAVLHCL